MDEVSRLQGRDEESKPADFFDYIFDTGTGGLSAIMLGRLEMSVNECLQEYETLGENVFAHRRAEINYPATLPVFTVHITLIQIFFHIMAPNPSQYMGNMQKNPRM